MWKYYVEELFCLDCVTKVPCFRVIFFLYKKWNIPIQQKHYFILIDSSNFFYSSLMFNWIVQECTNVHLLYLAVLLWSTSLKTFFYFLTECDIAWVLKMSSIGLVAMVITMVSVLQTPSYDLSLEISTRETA